MNNERAIELLHRLQDEQFDGIHGDERREALDMAVRALEGDGDTISRKMAINAMRKLQKWNIMREDYKNVGFSYDDVMFTLEKLTSAQPEITEDDVKEYCRKRCLIVVSSDFYDEMTRRWASAQPKQYWIDSEGKISALPSGQIATDKNVGDTISRQQAIDAYGDWYVEEGTAEGFIGTVKQLLEGLPSAQPELLEHEAYIRGFEQGRTQGMIDAQERKK